MKQIRELFSTTEIIALVIGLALLVVGVVWQVQSAKAVDAPVPVKQSVINMQQSDFNEDPALQNAIQKQLGGSNQNGATAQTPQAQAQPEDSTTKAGGLLQSAMSGLQAH